MPATQPNDEPVTLNPWIVEILSRPGRCEVCDAQGAPLERAGMFVCVGCYHTERWCG